MITSSAGARAGISAAGSKAQPGSGTLTPQLKHLTGERVSDPGHDSMVETETPGPELFLRRAPTFRFCYVELGKNEIFNPRKSAARFDPPL